MTIKTNPKERTFSFFSFFLISVSQHLGFRITRNCKELSHWSQTLKLCAFLHCTSVVGHALLRQFVATSNILQCMFVCLHRCVWRLTQSDKLITYFMSYRLTSLTNKDWLPFVPCQRVFILLPCCCFRGFLWICVFKNETGKEECFWEA